MNDWITLKEFVSYAEDTRWFGWCWIDYDGCSEIAYYFHGVFYFNDNTQDEEKWDSKLIWYVIPLQRPPIKSSYKRII